MSVECKPTQRVWRIMLDDIFGEHSESLRPTATRDSLEPKAANLIVYAYATIMLGPIFCESSGRRMHEVPGGCIGVRSMRAYGVNS
jgi:hypothetical protein